MSKRTYIIAEAGVNHNGSTKTAKELIDVAVDAGADAIKFQSFQAKKLVVEDAQMASYQVENTGKNESQLKLLQKLELSFDAHKELYNYCEGRIDFLSTPFDSDSLKMLIDEFKLPIIKISSGDLTNAPLLLDVAKTKTNVIISTGMSNIDEIKEALGVLSFGFLEKTIPSVENFATCYNSEEGKKILKEKVSILHCTTQYPTPMEDVNLNAMITLKNEFNLKTGYSDHTLGIHVSVCAVSLGAEVIEKHFTLDKKMEGPDHRASLNPEELKLMVKEIREIEYAMGSTHKDVTPSELENKTIARKSIVASKEIKKGDLFTEENLTFKRPEGGLRPIRFWECLGSKATRDFKLDEKVEL